MPKDMFANRANLYAKYRPVYPEELFDHILQFVPEKNIAWDCATGNGQAAFAFATRFKKVFGTDISEKQLSLAKQHPNIEYQIASAENTNFPDNTFDLITVAQAYHWFKFNAFEKEVRRVSKKNAIIAVWGYNLVATNDEVINDVIKYFYAKVVGPYWDVERKYVDDNYDSAPFNFSPLPVRDFFINTMWSKDDLIGYINSWSCVPNFIADKKYNPIDDIINDLELLWKDVKPVSFPLFLKLGRVN